MLSAEYEITLRKAFSEGMQAASVRIGCAGWNIPTPHRAHFPESGSHLERYAARFHAVEIDSSFYRCHRRTTYSRWATAVPPHFQFAIKVPREITHVRRLGDATGLDAFLSGPAALGSKLGPLLVQLPPSLSFDRRLVVRFFEEMRKRFGGSVVCEPRHPSWLTSETDKLLGEFEVARVAADPAPLPRGTEPGGWNGLVYYRLHGSPNMYYSEYSLDYLDALRTNLTSLGPSVATWCIFDNTARGAATVNALALLERLQI